MGQSDTSRSGLQGSHWGDFCSPGVPIWNNESQSNASFCLLTNNCHLYLSTYVNVYTVGTWFRGKKRGRWRQRKGEEDAGEEDMNHLHVNRCESFSYQHLLFSLDRLKLDLTSSSNLFSRIIHIAFPSSSAFSSSDNWKNFVLKKVQAGRQHRLFFYSNNCYKCVLHKLKFLM